MLKWGWLLLWLCWASVSWAEAPQVVAARVGVEAGKTRLVIEFAPGTKIQPPKLLHLSKPDRVVLDFPTLQFKTNVAALALPPGAVIKKVRAGAFSTQVTRVVLELTQPTKTKLFSLAGNRQQGPRVGVDFFPTTPRVQVKEVVRRPTTRPTPAAVSPSAEIPAGGRTASDGTIVIQGEVTPVVTAVAGKKRRPVVVVIDPGHGGVDPGAIGKGKTYEKDVVLAVAKAVRDELLATPGYKVYLTRERDVFVPLAERVRIAQRRQADLFVSIHADAHANREIRGGSAYVLSEVASDAEAERLARIANEGDLVAGIDLSEEDSDVRNILIDLVQRETMNKSAVFARFILEEKGKVVKLRSTEPRFAGFRVLKAPEIPSVLCELSYMSNPQDEKMLNTPAAQARLAGAIARGIIGYAQRYLDHD